MSFYCDPGSAPLLIQTKMCTFSEFLTSFTLFILGILYGEQIDKGTKTNIKNNLLAKILYCVTQMHIYIYAFYIPKKYVEMTNYGVWNNFHHSKHCKTFWKSNNRKLLYDMFNKGTMRLNWKLFPYSKLHEDWAI